MLERDAPVLEAMRQRALPPFSAAYCEGLPARPASPSPVAATPSGAAVGHDDAVEPDDDASTTSRGRKRPALPVCPVTPGEVTRKQP